MGVYKQTEYSIGGAEIPVGKIKNIDIHWVAGNIIIQQSNVNIISVSEKVIKGMKKNPLEYKVEDETLTIHHCSRSIQSFHFRNFATKELTILIPKELATSIEHLTIHTASSDAFIKDINCKNITIESSSGTCELDKLKIGKMHYKTASGTLQMEDCNLDQGNIISASGNIQFKGMLHSLSCNNISGNTELNSSICPEFLSLESVSGAEKLILPEYASFRAMYKTVSGKFTSNYPCMVCANEMKCGLGTGKYNFKTVTGNICVDKLVS